MVLTQSSMDIKPDIELHNAAQVEPDKESKCVLANSDETRLKCTNDHKDISIVKEALSNGHTLTTQGPEDVEVDILKFTTSVETRVTKTEDPDATEYSSSFGNTESDNERCSGLSEAEVESQYFGDSTYDSFGSLFQMRCVVVSC